MPREGHNALLEEPEERATGPRPEISRRDTSQAARMLYLT